MPDPAFMAGASTDATPSGPAARALPLSAPERASLMRAGALALDATRREVLMGLSVPQSRAYLAAHQALTLQLERARLRRSAEAPGRGSVATRQAAMNA